MNRIATPTRTRAIAVVAMVGVFGGYALSLAGGASAVSATDAPAQGLRLQVRRYPRPNERLQTGNNPISVAFGKDPIVVGSYFNDAQGRSYVLALDYGQAKPDVSQCPRPVEPTPSVEPSVEPTPSVEPPRRADPLGRAVRRADPVGRAHPSVEPTPSVEPRPSSRPRRSSPASSRPRRSSPPVGRADPVRRADPVASSRPPRSSPASSRPLGRAHARRSSRRSSRPRTSIRRRARPSSEPDASVDPSVEPDGDVAGLEEHAPADPPADRHRRLPATSDQGTPVAALLILISVVATTVLVARRPAQPPLGKGSDVPVDLRLTGSQR